MPQLARQRLDLQLQMPPAVEIPPHQQDLGAKQIEFPVGRHEV
jgi:hypothetical protein